MVRKSSESDPKKYTKPALRDRIKKCVTDGDKGGKAGQWSARKAQLVTHEYEKEGGGYAGGGRDAQQKSLKQWGAEKWTTADGKKAARKGGTTRYLPKKAWDELTPSQKKATNRKKQEGSRTGKQFVANTESAAVARKHAVKKTSAKKTSVKKTSAAKKTRKATAKKS